MNNYNLQPLSPNMITRAPMSAYMGSARAAAANLGNPTGNPGQGALETLESRLAELSRMSQLEAQLAEQQASGKSMEQNAQLLGRKDQMEHETGMAQEELDHKRGLAEKSLLSQIVEKTAGFKSIGDALGVLADSQRPDPTDLEAVKNYKPNMGARALAWLNTQMGKMIPGVQKAQMARDAAYELQTKAAQGIASADDYLANYETQSLEQFDKLSGLIAEMENSTDEQTSRLAAEAMRVLRGIGYQGRAIEILRDLEGVGGMGHEEGAGRNRRVVGGISPAVTEEFYNSLKTFEGEEGDTLTGIPTGKLGVTQGARDYTGHGKDVDDEVVARDYIEKAAREMPDVFKQAPEYVQSLMFDAHYNLGPGSVDWSGFQNPAKRGDWEGLSEHYLKTATADKGQTVKGLASRRAALYNLVAYREGRPMITELTQEDGGKLIYRLSDGRTITVPAPYGRHRGSKPGSMAPEIHPALRRG